MTIAKSYVRFTREPGNDYYSAVLSKEKTPYAVYVVDASMSLSDSSLYCGATEIVEMKTILTKHLVDSDKTIQSTPFFYCSQTQWLCINIINFMSSSLYQAGLGSLAVLYPIIITDTAGPTYKTIGKITIDGRNLFISSFDIDQSPMTTTSPFLSGIIYYPPGENLDLQPSNKRLLFSVANQQFSCNVTPNGIAKTITTTTAGVNTGLLFANGVSSQNDAQSTQISYGILPGSLAITDNAGSGCLVDGFYKGTIPAAPYANYYQPTSPSTTAKMVSIMPSTGTAAKRAFSFQRCYILGSLELNRIFTQDNKPLGSFYITPCVLTVDDTEIAATKEVEFRITYPRSVVDKAGIYEFSGEGFMYTVGYSAVQNNQSPYPQGLTPYKIKIKHGEMRLTRGGSASYASVDRAAGEIIYLLDEQGIPYFPAQNPMLLFMWASHALGRDAVPSLIIVTYEDDSQETKNISAKDGGSTVLLNLCVIEGGTKIKRIPYSSMSTQVLDLPNNVSPFSRTLDESLLADGYIFPNAADKKIKKIAAFANIIRNQRATTKVYFIIDGVS